MPAKTPEQCDELFGVYVNSRNLDQLVALYEPNASLGNEDGTTIQGTVAIRESLKQSLAALPEAKITLKVVRVIPAGDGLAVLYNDWSLVGKATDGSSVTLDHHAIEVVRRQPDGNWLFVVDDPYARG